MNTQVCMSTGSAVYTGPVAPEKPLPPDGEPVPPEALAEGADEEAEAAFAAAQTAYEVAMVGWNTALASWGEAMAGWNAEMEAWQAAQVAYANQIKAAQAAHADAYAAYQIAVATWEATLEAYRITVDRIEMAGETWVIAPSTLPLDVDLHPYVTPGAPSAVVPVEGVDDTTSWVFLPLEVLDEKPRSWERRVVVYVRILDQHPEERIDEVRALPPAGTAFGQVQAAI